MDAVNREHSPRNSDDDATTEAHVLIEHTGNGNANFSRVDNSSFSAEDRTALKHVATVVALLLAIALVLGLIAITA